MRPVPSLGADSELHLTTSPFSTVPAASFSAFVRGEQRGRAASREVVGSTSTASMDLVRRDADRSAATEFVALDIRGEAESPESNSDLVMIESAFAGKALERERNGDTNSSFTGMAGVYEKQTVNMNLDGSPREQLHPLTPTAGGVKRRRASRRIPGWRDPRKILFTFAALSSVGTLILLYFTLSMGKTAGGQADGQ